MSKPKKQKKPLTTEEKIKRNRLLRYGSYGGIGLSLITPFIIMGAVNFNDWFIETGEGWKIGLGGALGLAVMGMAVFLVTQNKEKENKMTSGWITLIVGWFTVAFIFKLLGAILEEMFIIMLFGGIGICAAFGFDITGKKCKNEADKLESAKKKVEQEELEEKIRAEKKEQKEKDKVEF